MNNLEEEKYAEDECSFSYGNNTPLVNKERRVRQLASLDDVTVPPLTVLSAGSAPSERWQRVDYLGGVEEKQIYGRPTA